MERQVSFHVTDYYPDGDEWSNDLVPDRELVTEPEPPSPIQQIPEVEISEDETEYVTITLDIREDHVSVVSVTSAGNGGSSVEDNGGSMVEDNGRLSVEENLERKFEAFRVLKGLTVFIDMTDFDWTAVEKRFHKMTAKTHGFLMRSKFGECVGINSEEFALELFDTLVRRWNVIGEVICLNELKEFWCQINDKSFESRLHIFFDMADKDGDGRLTQDKVRKFIRLAASANNQSTMQEKADEYAALIMEEFDPDDLGYISMEIFKLLLLNVDSSSESTNTEETKKHTKRWKVSSLIPCLKKTTSTKKI